MSLLISSNLTRRSYQWGTFKSISLIKNGLMQYENDGETYTIWFYDGPEIFICTIWLAIVPDVFSQNGYTQTQNDIDRNDFETNFLPNANKTITIRTLDGREHKIFDKSEDIRKTFTTHDYTDPTTWYGSSIYVLDEVATDSGDQLTYTLAHANVIDVYHGKLFQEDFLKDSSNRSYRVTVKVNDVVKTEQDPHLGTGGDFTVNYVAGSVTFFSALNPLDVVKVTYHYATDSVFIIKPDSGKMLKIGAAEFQFTDDIVLTDTIKIQPYGFVEIFDPANCTTNGGSIPPGTKIPLGPAITYKTIVDYLSESSKAYPVYPALGGTGWRGINKSIFTFHWEYVSNVVINSITGMEVRVSLHHDTPLTGTFATGTFYCTTT